MTKKNASSPMRWMKRIALGTALVVLTLAGLGASYQAVSARADARQYPPTGTHVDVGDFTMHLHCTGEGSPTVVLEAGATGFGETWAWIQPELSAQTRVCSYDRAGMGWSEGQGTGHDGTTIAHNLHTLLSEAGEPGPYVLVGHSLGGALVRIFAERYPSEVVAVGLIDSSHEDQHARFPADYAEEFTRFRQTFKLASSLAHVGVLRATNLIGRSAAGLPEPAYGAARMFAASPTHLRTSFAELEAWDATMDAARTNRSLGDRPLAVVSASELMDGMPPGMIEVNQQMHAELSTLSSRGRHYILPGTTHFSLLMQREHAEAVATILQALIDEARTVGDAEATDPREPAGDAEVSA